MATNISSNVSRPFYWLLAQAEQEPTPAQAVQPTTPKVSSKTGKENAPTSNPQEAPKEKQDPKAKPPRTDETVEVIHGTRVADPLRWMEDDKSPEVVSWVNSKNDAADRYFKSLGSPDKLKTRFAQLYETGTTSVAAKRGNSLFYAGREKGQQKEVLYVSRNGKEQILLDSNSWPSEKNWILGQWVPDPSGRYVAYAVVPNGREDLTFLEVIDVETLKTDRLDHLENMKYSLPGWLSQPVWNPDGEGFYYSWFPSDPSIPETERQGRAEVRYHKLHLPQTQDRVIYRNTGDSGALLHCYPTRDGKTLLLAIRHYPSRAEIHYRPVNGSPQEFVPLANQENSWSDVCESDGILFNFTDWESPNRQILRGESNASGKIEWKPFLPERPDFIIKKEKGVFPMGKYILVHSMHNAHSALEIFDLAGNRVRQVELPDYCSITDLDADPAQSEAYVVVESLTLPPSIYRLDVPTGKLTIWKKADYPVDLSTSTIDEFFFRSTDGTPISMFTVAPTSLKKDGKTPFLMFGYGGWGWPLEPRFYPWVVPWLEAGGGFAIATVRGGGEYGKTWQDGGRKENKQRSFDDFNAVGEFLVRNRFTHPDRLAIMGNSFGGLLVSGAMVQRPDLYRAVLCEVPVTDMLRYHLSGIGRNWVNEFGSVEKESEFQTLYGYSPYHNLREPVRYPALLVLSAGQDERMKPFHARKFVGRLDVLKNDMKGPVLLRTQWGTGHSGAEAKDAQITEMSEKFGFLMDQVGLQE